MSIVAAILAGSLVLFGAVVFVSIARPHFLMGWMAWWSGEQAAWREGRSTEEQMDRYLLLIQRSQPLLLVLVFALSFVVGAVVALSRL